MLDTPPARFPANQLHTTRATLAATIAQIGGGDA
jgi:hypothetical protein